MLSQTDDDLKKLMLIPYAEYLAKNNRFEEAQQYYKEAGRIDLSMEILEKNYQWFTVGLMILMFLGLTKIIFRKQFLQVK